MRRLVIAVLAFATLLAACDRIIELERQPPPDGSFDAANGDGGNHDGGLTDALGDGGVGPDV